MADDKSPSVAPVFSENNQNLGSSQVKEGGGGSAADSGLEPRMEGCNFGGNPLNAAVTKSGEDLQFSKSNAGGFNGKTVAANLAVMETTNPDGEE
jgi:hypothetical protein